MVRKTLNIVVIIALMLILSQSVMGIITSPNLVVGVRQSAEGDYSSPGIVMNVYSYQGLLAFLSPPPSPVSPGTTISVGIDYQFTVPATGPLPANAWFVIDEEVSPGDWETYKTYHVTDIESDLASGCNANDMECAGSTVFSFTTPSTGTYVLYFEIRSADDSTLFDYTAGYDLIVGEGPCQNDPGCSASNVGETQCCGDQTVDDSMKTCTEVDGCYVWRYERCSNLGYDKCYDGECGEPPQNCVYDGITYGVGSKICSSDATKVLECQSSGSWDSTSCGSGMYCQNAVCVDGNGGGCLGEQEIFYTDELSFTKPCTYEQVKDVIDDFAPSFTERYRENKDVACCEGLIPVFDKDRFTEFDTDLCGHVTVSYSVYKCVSKDGTGFCLDFAHKMLNSYTHSDCQTNTIILIVLVLGSLVVFARMMG